MELNANMSDESPSQPAPPPEADFIPPPLHTVVLVVDDEVQIRRLLRGCLERNGYEVVEAATGEQALAEAIRCQPNVILLDQVLPDMDGLAVLKRLREWSKVPIFIVSVRDRDMDKVAALDHGANDYLSKPISASELLARLRVVRYKPALCQTQDFHLRRSASGSDRAHRQCQGTTGKSHQHRVFDPALFCSASRPRLTHRQILREIWHLDDPEKTTLLRVYMTYLRAKIEAIPAKPKLLITVPGVGYRLEIRD